METNTDNNIQTPKMYTEDDVQRMMKDRLAREESRRKEELSRKEEEAASLKKQLEDLEKKMQQGTATNAEIDKLQAAKGTATQGVQAGYSPEEMQSIVDFELKKKDLTGKLQEAIQKDPEFKKLYEQNGKNIPTNLIMGTSYLPNAVAVVKHLMKDKKSLELYAAAAANAHYDNAVSAMQILNNFSDRLADNHEKPHPSMYEPAPQLADASDEDQNFDESTYIKSKY